MIGPVASEISARSEAEIDGDSARSSYTYLALPSNIMAVYL